MSIKKSPKNYLISMVVDNLPEHYFKAELLLFSLRKFGEIPSKNIIVQCVDRVDSAFKDFVHDGGYRFREVTPYLDGTYCNKLQQLDDLADEIGDACGIFLLDVDMALLDQLDVPCFDKVLGKIVDAPNPPIDVLERIFSAAEMPSPGRVSCDWGIGDTLATNFNGGFLFIPAQFVSTVSSLWRHWAEWLYQRPELFDTPQQRIHTDQVAMALTLASGAVPFTPITANFNFPTHAEHTPRTFDDGAALRVLHYHTGINPFGLIEPTHGKTLAVQIAVDKINEAVADKNAFTFFDGLKRHQALRMSKTTKHSHPYLHATLSSINSLQTRRRLILHAGTPKTGTSSLQSCLDQNRAAMLEMGLLYPHSDGSSRMPKHQWIVGCLTNCDEHGFADNLQNALKDIITNTHTVVLSTEGIFNHWWDYNSYAKSMLASLGEWFDIEVLVWFRAPEDFANSLYRQYLTNPRNSVGPCYGKDISFQEMLGDPWFIRHFDYLGFIRDVQATFGEKAICPIVYAGDTVESFKNLMGITDLPGYVVRENLSIEQLGVELIRIINRQNLGEAAKSHASLLVKQLETLMEGGGKPFVLSGLDKSRIRTITALGNAVLKDEFGLYWEKEPGN